MTGFDTTADSYVEGIPSVYCTTLGRTGAKIHLSGAPTNVGGTGFPGGNFASLSCPAGSVITGASGRIGNWLDQVGFLCEVLRPDGTLGSSSATAAVGGSGGASASAICPAGEMATAARLFTDGVDQVMAGIALTCAGVVRIAADPSSGPPGTTVTISGAQFASGERVKVKYQTRLSTAPSVAVCTAISSADGTFVCSGTIPPQAQAGPAGRHLITATGVTSRSRAVTAFRLT